MRRVYLLIRLDFPPQFWVSCARMDDPWSIYKRKSNGKQLNVQMMGCHLKHVRKSFAPFTEYFMYHKFYLPILTTSLALAISQAYAAEPLSLQEVSFHDAQQFFQLILPDHRLSRAPSADALQFVKQHTDTHRITHLRMQQKYVGFSVFGGYAIMHSEQPAKALFSMNNKVNMSGRVYRGLKADLGQPAAIFIDNASIALQKFKAQFQGVLMSEEQSVPMVYIDETHHAFWAYKVSVLLTYDDKIPERQNAIINAQSFKPFVQWNSLKTIHSDIKGMGFGGNVQTKEYQFGKDFPWLNIRRDDVANICYMENKDVKVVDMVHKYSGPNTPMRFSCEESQALSDGIYWTGYQGNGYDLENGAYSPTNDAMYAGQVIKSMYRDWFDLNVLETEQGRPMKLIMRVHFGRGYENAFWDSHQMTFGDGDNMMYPLVSVGIGAHEISHGFTEQHANLEYFGQSGGMNESFSDMAAQAAEYYSQGKNSWMIGAEIMKEESGYKALRFMDEPARDGASIGRADQYRDGLDVHHSSGVYNHLFYVLVHQPEWTVKQAFNVMLKANMDYWTPYSTFEEGACGIIDAAKDLGFSVDDVKHALDEVAIKHEACGQSQP